MTETVWSPSRVNTIRHCPYAYYKTYVEKVDRVGNYFAYRGSAIHHGQEDYYKYLLAGGKPLDIQAVRDTLKKKFKREMKDCPHPAQMVFANGFTKNLSLESLLESFDVYTPLTDVIHVEREIKFDVKGIPFKGFIDLERRWIEPNGVTGEDTPRYRHYDFKSENKEDYKLQQYLYVHGLRQEGLHIDSYGIIEYKNGFREVIEWVDDGKMKFVIADTVEAVELADKLGTDEKNFKKNPENRFFCMNLCGLCEHGKP